MGAPSGYETDSLRGEGQNIDNARDFLTMEVAAFDIQSHFRSVVSGAPGTARLTDKWILSNNKNKKQLQLVITATEIRPPIDNDEEMKIKAANTGLIFCNKHGVIPDNPGKSVHLLETPHDLGDYTVDPERNNPGIDQIQIRTIGYDHYPLFRGKDTVSTQSLRRLDEPDIQEKIVRKILNYHWAKGTYGSLAESIEIALAKREISVDFANALGVHVAELALKDQAIRAGINPRITEVVFNFRRPESGGVSYCCKP